MNEGREGGRKECVSERRVSIFAIGVYRSMTYEQDGLKMSQGVASPSINPSF